MWKLNNRPINYDQIMINFRSFSHSDLVADYVPSAGWFDWKFDFTNPKRLIFQTLWKYISVTKWDVPKLGSCSSPPEQSESSKCCRSSITDWYVWKDGSRVLLINLSLSEAHILTPAPLDNHYINLLGHGLIISDGKVRGLLGFKCKLIRLNDLSTLIISRTGYSFGRIRYG